MRRTRLSFMIYLLLACVPLSAQLMNVRKWRATERDSLEKAIELFDEKMYLRALPIFESLLALHPKEEFLKYSYAKCALYRSDKHEEAYRYFTQIYNNNKKVPGIQYDMALACLYNYKFDEAEEYIQQYAAARRQNPEDKKNADMVKRNITYARYYLANPTNARVTNLGASVNSGYDEYVPAITADESALIFTYAGARSLGGRLNEDLNPDRYGNFMEDIYISYRVNGVFQPALPLDSLNTVAPDAAISLSEDGRLLFIYQDIGDGHGDIYQSIRTGDHFSKPVRLKGEVNSYSWDGHCSLAPDGRTLYFSSERGGGYGGRDIYRATLSLPDSVWGDVVNLGDSVNTPYDDDAPFIHPDGITLFYSSKGRTSMGGYDIFRAVMSPEDSVFRQVENLGYPINSTSDDIYFVMGASGTNAYYSSGKKEGMGMKDIYHVEPNFSWPKPSLYLLRGQVKQGEAGVAATIQVDIVSEPKRAYKTVYARAGTGEYLLSLPAGASYQLSYTYKDLPVRTLSLDATNLSGYEERSHHVNLAPPPEVLASAAVKPDPKKSAAQGGKAPAKAAPAVKEQPVAPEKILAQTSAPAVTERREEPVSGSPVAAKTRTPAQAAWDFTANPVTSTPLVLPDKPSARAGAEEEFVPVNGPQIKSVRYTEKYGEVKADDMEFRVQVAAVKNDNNTVFPNQKLLGRVEKLNLNDGFIRITVGGSFKTLGEAMEHNKQVVRAGQKEGFIIALYKGRRVSFDELEQMGLLK